MAPHQCTLEGFWFDEVPEGAVHEQACHVSRRVLVGDGALRRHEREVIVEHGLKFALLFRLSAIEGKEVADGLHHAFEHESRLLRTAVQESVGASSVGAHISFEEVSKGSGEVAIFPRVSLARDEVEERVDVSFKQIFAQGENRHHQAEFVLQVVDISRLVELIHHPLDGVFRLVVVEELERLNLEFCHFHFGGNLIAYALTFCGAESLEPFRLFEHVEGDAAIEFEEFHPLFRLQASFACQGRNNPLVGIGHCQQRFHGPEWRLLAEQFARSSPCWMREHHAFEILLLCRSGIPQLEQCGEGGIALRGGQVVVEKEQSVFVDFLHAHIDLLSWAQRFGVGRADDGDGHFQVVLRFISQSRVAIALRSPDHHEGISLIRFVEIT